MAQIAYWEDIPAKVVTTEERHKSLDAQYWGDFLRGRESRKSLESDYNQTRVIMTDLGLAK